MSKEPQIPSRSRYSLPLLTSLFKWSPDEFRFLNAHGVCPKDCYLVQARLKLEFTLQRHLSSEHTYGAHAAHLSYKIEFSPSVSQSGRAGIPGPSGALVPTLASAPAQERVRAKRHRESYHVNYPKSIN